ncbi:MAG: hypothetical protein EHM41_11485 [Chloroflexi bacterium]|nr:MAG: hypothetical protein EHM41_11485 [Chloroflexota bacterium]
MWKNMNTQAIHTEQVKLEKFNRMVQQYQDEAFMLAYYFLGNEAEAVETVESAVQKAYRGGKSASRPFRLWFFRNVITECQRRRDIQRKVKTELQAGDSTGIEAMIFSLPGKMRIVIILVDLLGLRYQEAALVCNLPVIMVQKMTAEARVSLC